MLHDFNSTHSPVSFLTKFSLQIQPGVQIPLHLVGRSGFLQVASHPLAKHSENSSFPQQVGFGFGHSAILMQTPFSFLANPSLQTHPGAQILGQNVGSGLMHVGSHFLSHKLKASFGPQSWQIVSLTHVFLLSRTNPGLQ